MSTIPTDPGYYKQVATTVIGGKLLPPRIRWPMETAANAIERQDMQIKRNILRDPNLTKGLPNQNRIQKYAESVKSYEAPDSINFAQLSATAYEKNKELYGYTVLPEYSSSDRTVWKHNDSGHVVIAFRGTDPKNLKDLSTDALLASGAQSLSYRFYNAAKVTKAVIDKYGKTNVSVTGHSLGGSQALYVSRKYGVNAHAFNPHVAYEEAFTATNYKDAHLYMNSTDPVPAFARAAYFKSKDVRNNPHAWYTLPQHPIGFWVDVWNSEHKPKSKPRMPTVPPSSKTKIM